MQIAFIDNLKTIVKDNKNKALLISATGTGKTYVSAFALRNMNPDRALFLVHREQIAEQAMKSYEDVCKLLNWDQNVVAQNIGGYKYDKGTNTFPVFINYHKSDAISDSIRYEDRFLDESTIIALSKQPRKIESKDVQLIYNAKETGMKIYLFVRKNKDDNISQEFYFLGEVIATGDPRPIVIKNTNKNAVEITYKLDTPVREDIYEYIISE